MKSSNIKEMAIYSTILAGVIYLSVLSAKTFANKTTTTGTNDLADAVNQFALKLYSKSLNGPNTKNYFISPFSVWMALSISYAGAKGNTSSELKDLLSFNLSDLEMFKQSERYLNTFFDIKNTSNYSLNLANKIYPKKDKEFSLNKNYSDLIKKYFKVDIQAINFTEKNAAAGIVNKWVSSKTANKINNILNPDLITKETRVILANAIYFKGFWVTKFDSGLTKKTPFNLVNGNKKDVDMMYIRNKMFGCLTDIADLDASACVFPYEGDSVSMTIILPNKNSSLSKLESKLDINKLRNVLNAKKTPSMIDVYIPKFKIEFKSDLKNDLIALGVTSPFNEKADFSEMSATPLKISNIVHQTFIDVNEEGTEATGATIISFDILSLILDPQEFKCDRPFMFFIHDTISKAILFMGKFNSP